MSEELERRLISIFEVDEHGRRPAHGECELYVNDPNWKDLILFYEYFHGDNGEGLGASHQMVGPQRSQPCCKSLGKKAREAEESDRLQRG